MRSPGRSVWSVTYALSTNLRANAATAGPYAYWGDGTLQTETFYWNNGSTQEERRVVKHAADAKLHPTFDQWGDATGSYSTARGFDAVGNQTGVGVAFNPEADWCQYSTGAASTYCTKLTYSRANRVGQIGEFPAPTSNGSGGTEVRTCVDHDVEGNVLHVSPGCTSDYTCQINSFSGSICGARTGTAGLTYYTDDFGNLVGAQLPYTFNGPLQAPGTTHYQYNATGQVVVRQTPQMAANGTGEYIANAYDNLGRLLNSYDWLGSTGTGLYALSYDTSAPPASGCPATTFTGGRLQVRTDNFGYTWLSYDAVGHVVKEIRLRAGQSSCTGNQYYEPHTTYGYNPDGVLTSVRDPYGRGGGGTTSTTPSWSYTVNASDRVTGVSIAVFNGTSWNTAPVISNAVWEPYGGLRGYEIDTPDGGSAAVEFMLGDNGTTSPGNGSSPPSTCPFTVASNSTGSDHTGRLRTLAVSTVALNGFVPGTATGNIYELGYKWQADQVLETDACLLGTGTPRSDQFNYDSMLRLTNANRPTGNFTAAGGSFGASTNQSYSWDGRSNGSGLTNDACTWSLGFNSALFFVDQMTSASCTGTGKLLAYNYAFDNDGRVTTKSWPNDSSGQSTWFQKPSYGDNGAFTNDSVYKAISVGNSNSSVTYSYYTDAFGRRRTKVYPSGNYDEFFYTVGNGFLSDQGLDNPASASWFVQEDYVWLGGKPVAIVRGEYTTAWGRQSDWTANCSRNGDGAPCGIYFPVSDHIGKAVAILDSTRRIAGEADYNPFGHPNRVNMDAESAHPYAFSGTTTNLGDMSQATITSPMTTQLRGRWAMVDTYNDGLCAGDTAIIRDVNNGNATLASAYGIHTGQVVTPWVTPTVASGAVHVQAALVQNSGHSRWICSPFCTCHAQFPSAIYDGAIMDAYEYRHYQAGAAPYWTPLRFPGQYYDAETDLVNNWNRNYDPAIGRYLQPDPMLARENSFLAANAALARGPNPYGYANENPIAFVDPAGLDPCCSDDPCSACDDKPDGCSGEGTNDAAGSLGPPTSSGGGAGTATDSATGSVTSGDATTTASGSSPPGLNISLPSVTVFGVTVMPSGMDWTTPDGYNGYGNGDSKGTEGGIIFKKPLEYVAADDVGDPVSFYWRPPTGSGAWSRPTQDDNYVSAPRRPPAETPGWVDPSEDGSLLGWGSFRGHFNGAGPEFGPDGVQTTGGVPGRWSPPNPWGPISH